MPNFALFWIWICVYLNCAGWVLSALHSLNGSGYLWATGLGLLLGWAGQKFGGGGLRPNRRIGGWCRRFRRPFPLAFLVLAGLVFLSGAWYAPSNYDSLAYRLPRILHWLTAGQWQWIHTLFPRLNGRACGEEWVLTPLIVLTGTDRLLFLTNAVSYLLLPGLIFSVFTRLGVRRSAAWYWMWLLPTGYGFLVQAGSLGNDLFGVPFALAAMDFALRARTTGSARDFFAAILAAAMLTGIKASNLPLLLPWAVAMLPNWRLMFKWPVQLALVTVVAGLASFLPLAVLNNHYAHDWTGVKVETGGLAHDPPLRLTCNAFTLTIQNLVPPIFPWSKNWDMAVQETLSPGLKDRLYEAYKNPNACGFKLPLMQTEEIAGLGSGVSLLLLASLVCAARQNGWKFLYWRFDSPTAAWLTSLRWLPWISLLTVLEQSSIYSLARVMTPYYGLLLPALLAGPAQARVVRQPWWRALGVLVFTAALVLLIVLPARPLFPAQTILSALAEHMPHNSSIQLAQRTYGIYAQRPAAFAPVLARLPLTAKTLGIITYDDPETALWQPFGSRRIVHICPEDTLPDLKAKGVEYVLIIPPKMEGRFHCPAAEWVTRMGGTIVEKIPLDLRVADNPVDWWLVKLPQVVNRVGFH